MRVRYINLVVVQAQWSYGSGWVRILGVCIKWRKKVYPGSYLTFGERMGYDSYADILGYILTIGI